MRKLFAVVLACLLLTGCNGVETSLTLKFDVDTGDAIQLKFNTTDGYSVSVDVPFVVSKAEETLMYGTFLHEEGFTYYLDAAKTDTDATVIEESSKNGNQYIFWSYNDEEYNYALFVGGTNTGVLLSSQVSEEVARECFDRMVFSIYD